MAKQLPCLVNNDIQIVPIGIGKAYSAEHGMSGGISAALPWFLPGQVRSLDNMQGDVVGQHISLPC